MQAFMNENSDRTAETTTAERYMNEQPRGMQRGARVRSAAPKISVSIPYGEESGGLLSMFRGLFSKKSSASESDTAEQEPQWEESPLFQEGGGGGEFENPLYDEDEAREKQVEQDLASTRLGDRKVSEGHDQARALSEAVIHNEQRHIGRIRIRDGEFASVRSSVKALNDLLDQPYPRTDIEKQKQGTQTILDQYVKTIEILQGYVTHIREKKGGRSPSGRARLDLVTQLIDLLSQDHHMFGTIADQLSRGVNAGITSWDEILRNARATDLTEGGAEIEVSGGGTSRILKRKTADDKVEYIKQEEKTITKAGYVKEFLAMVGTASSEGAHLIEECLDYFTRNPLQGKDGPLSPMACMEEYFLPLYRHSNYVFLSDMPQKKEGQSDDEVRTAQLEFVHRQLKLNATDDYKLSGLLRFIDQDDDRALQFADTMVFLKKKNLEQYTSEAARIQHGSTISDRNESTSILAERMGLSDVVAKSRTIMIKNASGDVVRANAMEGAKGKAVSDWVEEAQAAEKADAEARAKEKTDRPPLKISISYTPHSLMKLNELMILDMISGQVDRNGGNFLVEVEKNPPGDDGQAIWYITSVTGIDNDMAFGTLLYSMIENHDDIHQMGTFTKTIRTRKKDQSGYEERQAQTIFYISRSTYDHIMSYSATMAEMDQRHLRSKDEIRALQDRLMGVKTELKKMVESGALTLAANERQEQEGYDRTKAGLEHSVVGYYIDKERIK